MQEVVEFLKILGVGILAIALVIFIKINDITTENPNLNFWQVARLFMKKAVASYLASLTALILYGILHDDVTSIFIDGGVPNTLLERMIALQMFMGFLVAGAMQWGYYKFFLKKTDNIMKIWSGSTTGIPPGAVSPGGGPDANTVAPGTNVDGTRDEKKDV